jgi:hypothetical protein
VMIIFTFVIGLVSPGTFQTTSEDDFPTVTPFGTLPPPTQMILPTPELNPRLEGELPYIHSSGAFQTFKPAGSDWYVDELPTLSDTSTARVVIQSSSRLAVIHNYLQPGVVYESLQDLSDTYLTNPYFTSAWQDYDSWEITGREITERAVIVNFNLRSNGNDYLGRDITRLDGTTLFVTRLVVPANNPPLLEKLAGLVTANFTGYPALQALPQAWPAYHDQSLGLILKYPAAWSQVAGGPGRPVTFTVPNDDGEARARLSVEQDDRLDDATAAEAWIAQESELRSGVTVLASAPVEHDSGSGYQVAYTFTDTAGDTHSGLAVLLNNEAGMLAVADLQVDPPDINFIEDAELAPAYDEARRALVEGFMILPPSAVQPVGPLAAEEQPAADIAGTGTPAE